MSFPDPPVDPRWGQNDRDSKALAILRTLQACEGRDVTNGVWLDVGCGSGGIAVTLATQVERVVGIDLEAWSRWESLCAMQTNLTLCQGSFCEVESLFEPGTFDVVVCNQVYEHVDDPVALLEAIHRALKPGGLCYFAGPNLLWPIEPHVHLPFVHWVPRRFALKLLPSRIAANLDAWSFDHWRLTGMFRRSGFAWENAIIERAHAESGSSRGSFLIRVVKALPSWVIDLVVPFSPGFVYILRKWH